jgi:hypothetical protein
MAFRSALERIFLQIKKAKSGCWIWTGAKSHGYAVIRMGHGKDGYNLLVHRVMLGFKRGSWKYGDLEPHHKCENPSCVRPSHLKMVSHRENILLGDSIASRNAKKERCDRGHLFTANNTILYERHRNKRISYERICRKCRRITMLKWRETHA